MLERCALRMSVGVASRYVERVPRSSAATEGRGLDAVPERAAEGGDPRGARVPVPQRPSHREGHGGPGTRTPKRSRAAVFKFARVSASGCPNANTGPDRARTPQRLIQQSPRLSLKTPASYGTRHGNCSINLSEW